LPNSDKFWGAPKQSAFVGLFLLIIGGIIIGGGIAFIIVPARPLRSILDAWMNITPTVDINPEFYAMVYLFGALAITVGLVLCIVGMYVVNKQDVISLKNKYVVLILALILSLTLLYVFFVAFKPDFPPTKYEQMEYEKTIVSINANGNFVISLELKNTGTATLTIGSVFLNNKPLDYYSGILNQNILGSQILPEQNKSCFVEVDEKTWESILLENSMTVNILMHTTAGKDYPLNIQLLPSVWQNPKFIQTGTPIEVIITFAILGIIAIALVGVILKKRFSQKSSDSITAGTTAHTQD